MTSHAKSTSAQLRRDIDSRRTGDKAPGLDPAAAPLGTDEEAGGFSPSPKEIEEARRLEGAGESVGVGNGVEPPLTLGGALKRSAWTSIGYALAIAAVITALIVADAVVL
jgi:hypothetical protein